MDAALKQQQSRTPLQALCMQNPPNAFHTVRVRLTQSSPPYPTTPLPATPPSSPTPRAPAARSAPATGMTHQGVIRASTPPGLSSPLLPGWTTRPRPRLGGRKTRWRQGGAGPKSERFTEQRGLGVGTAIACGLQDSDCPDERTAPRSTLCCMPRLFCLALGRAFVPSVWVVSLSAPTLLGWESGLNLLGTDTTWDAAATPCLPGFSS